MKLTPPIETVQKALGFLLARQADDGSWRDWQLPLGQSRMWTTAYAGYRLCSIGAHRFAATRPALDRAARWLLTQEFADGGWGYSHKAGADADSTALVILFLDALGMTPSTRAYARLLAFQCLDGGFATYAPPNGFGAWAMPQADVTAIAVTALLTRIDCSTPPVQRGIKYALRSQSQSGLWNSYWWDSPLYATETNIAMLLRAGAAFSFKPIRAALDSIEPKNCFERALHVLILDHLRRPVRELNEVLAHEQLEDGSWPAEPMLRLTDPECCEPWNATEPGPLFADPDRIFTTATAIAAQARMTM